MKKNSEKIFHMTYLILITQYLLSISKVSFPWKMFISVIRQFRVRWDLNPIQSLIVQSPRLKKIWENTVRVYAVVGPYLRLELSDSSCSSFSTELTIKNRFNFLFGGFSWYELAHSGFFWEQDSKLSFILH